MDYVTLLLGLVAASITSFAYLPQVIKSYKTKQTKDLSMPMILTLVFGIILWLIYGIRRKDIALVSANIITFLFLFSLLILKIRHK